MISGGCHRDFCLYLMGQFFNKHLIIKLIIENTQISKCLNEQPTNLSENPIIQRIVNLPDKLVRLYETKIPR